MRKTKIKSWVTLVICLFCSAVLVLVCPVSVFADCLPDQQTAEQQREEPEESSNATPERSGQVSFDASKGSQEDSSAHSADMQTPSDESVASLQNDASSVPISQQELAATQTAPDISAAQDNLDTLSGYLDSLALLKQDWDELYSAYASERDELEHLQDEHAGLTAKIKKHDEDAERAQAVIDAANDELSLIEGDGFTAYVLRLIRPSEVESKAYLLHELIVDRDSVVLSANAAKSGLERAQEELSEKMQVQGKTRLESRSKLSMSSCEVEAACSRARKCLSDTLASLPDPGENQQTQEDVARIQGQAQLAAGSIAEYEAGLARYYDDLDAVSGANGAISFGEGADFSMSEYVFVEKWGKAIDAFMEAYAKEAGEVPLRSHGRLMASAAYRYRIDPRLCAAVSIAESGGGRSCIKPYNAWGWGAVDSNPYEGAASWNSFDEAIEQWHKGMAGSKTGLATARTVSTLAVVYCSNPAWGADVAEAMGKISSFSL